MIDNSVLLIVFYCILGINFPRATIEPLSLSVTPAEQTVGVGAEIKVRTKLTNITNHVLSFFDTNFDCDYMTEMRDDSGNPAPETHYKKQLSCNESVVGDSRNILVTLKPQESVMEEIQVTRLYELNHPGNYVLQVRRRIPKDVGNGPIKSNSVTITVEGPKP